MIYGCDVCRIGLRVWFRIISLPRVSGDVMQFETCASVFERVWGDVLLPEKPQRSNVLDTQSWWVCTFIERICESVNEVNGESV